MDKISYDKLVALVADSVESHVDLSTSGRVAGAWVEFNAPSPAWGGFSFWARLSGDSFAATECLDPESGGAPSESDLDSAYFRDLDGLL